MAVYSSVRATRQPWVADRDSLVRDTGHTINWALVPESYRQRPGQQVTVSAAAIVGAVALAVNALERAIPSGTTIVFTPSTGEYATLSAPAAAGATSLTVQPLASAFEGGEVGTIPGSGPKTIPSGTRMGTLLSGDGQLVPRVAATNPAMCILETDANEDSKTDARSGYGVILGGSIYENLLPGATGTPRRILAAERTELRDADQTTSFAWQQYVDSSAS